MYAISYRFLRRMTDFDSVVQCGWHSLWNRRFPHQMVDSAPILHNLRAEAEK